MALAGKISQVSESQVTSSSVESLVPTASHHPHLHQFHWHPSPKPSQQLELPDPPWFATIVSRCRAEPIVNTTYMGDSQSCPCHISCPQPHYGFGQLLNQCIHLFLQEAGLGVLHSCQSAHFRCLFRRSAFMLADGPVLVLKNIFFGLSNSASCPGWWHYDTISLIAVSPLLTLTGDSQYSKLGGGVLYHTSSGQICFTPGQDPSRLDDDVTQYMWHGLL